MKGFFGFTKDVCGSYLVRLPIPVLLAFLCHLILSNPANGPLARFPESTDSKKQITSPFLLEESFQGLTYSDDNPKYKAFLHAPDSTRVIVTGAEFDLPVIVNDHVRKWIHFYTVTHRRTIELYLLRGKGYLPMMRKILRESELPEDLALMPLLESGMVPSARSSRHAVGPWQFIESTAKIFNLQMNGLIDERRDVEKSTRAAASYLKRLYGIFQSWPLVLAGYNAGENKILRTMRQLGTSSFWKMASSKRLQNETKNYVPKLMALSIIFKNLELYDFNREIEDKTTFSGIRVPASTHLSSIATETGLSLSLLEHWNPELKKGVTPPGSRYPIKIPTEFEKFVRKALKRKKVEIEKAKKEDANKNLNMAQR